MVTRRGRGGRNRMMGDARDEVLQALRRQVEELTLRLDRQGARIEHGQSLGYSSDGSDLTKEVHKLIVGNDIQETEDSICKISKQSTTLSQVQQWNIVHSP